MVVVLLLRWRADETVVDEDGDTPAERLDTVHEKRECSQDEIDRVRLLLRHHKAMRFLWIQINHAMTLNDRTFNCLSCGISSSRDGHAARNIDLRSMKFLTDR